MAFTDAQFVLLNLPPNCSFTYNGVTFTPAQAVTAALDEFTTREGALAVLFAMLEADNVQSETLGKYSYSKYQMKGSDYWGLRAAGIALESNGAPNVALRPRPMFGGFWRWSC